MKHTIEITNEHAKRASQYCSNEYCLLATALRDHFPDADISCGASHFHLNDEEHEIPVLVFREIHKAYGMDKDDDNERSPVVEEPFSFVIDTEL